MAISSKIAALISSLAALGLAIAALLAAWSMNVRTIQIKDGGVYRLNVITGDARICFYRGYEWVETMCDNADPPAKGGKSR
jgi:hypothetical protein